MWRDVSDQIRIKSGKIIFENQIVGIIENGIIGVAKEGYRVRMEREYDDDGYVNRFFVEKDTSTETIAELFRIAREPANIVPFVEVRNMRLLELEIKNKPIYFNVEMIESFEQKGGNISVVRMQSGITYEVDYNAQRIKQKIEEVVSKPVP